MVVTRHKFSGISFHLPDGGMTDDQFYQFCQLNPDLRIERNADKEILIMPPANSDTGNKNFEIAAEIAIWNRKHNLGHGFDSSSGFTLPNGAQRSPDVAWISREKWAALPEEEKRRFAPIAPDFVIELRSLEQSIGYLKEKMEEYIECGCRLGWLIDAENRRTYVYEGNGDIHTVPFEELLDGKAVLPGFELRLSDLF